MSQRLLVRYTGRVQGVGFRAGARQIAFGFRVGGWVKNLADGSVEMLVSGEPKEIAAFLQALRDSRLGSFIDREVQEPQAGHEPEKGFEIRH